MTRDVSDLGGTNPEGISRHKNQKQWSFGIRFLRKKKLLYIQRTYPMFCELSDHTAGETNLGSLGRQFLEQGKGRTGPRIFRSLDLIQRHGS